jgi:hypothetical protein
MNLLKSPWLIVGAALLVAVIYWFRPGGVEGPRVAPVAPEGKDVDHSALTEALTAAIGPEGQIDYAGLRANPAALDRYLGLLSTTSPASAPHRFKSDEARLAYYVNAYNAFLLAAIRDACPIRSPQEPYLGGGLFWRVSFDMGGQPVTLDELQNSLIREVFRADAAVHFVRHLGAAGGPPLQPAALTPRDVRARAADAMKALLRDPRFVRAEGDVIHVSSFFDRYQLDFGGDVKRFLERERPDLFEGRQTPPRLQVFEMDWSLNGGCG